MPALRRITLALIVGLVLTGTAASGPGGDAGVASSCLRWKLVPSPAEGDWNVLEAVAARSGDDAWAVGWDTSDTAELTYAQHWDGRGWMVAATPNVPGYHPYGEQDYLLAVTIVGTADAWAV